jgi:hypothetical protein
MHVMISRKQLVLHEVAQWLRFKLNPRCVVSQ